MYSKNKFLLAFYLLLVLTGCDVNDLLYPQRGEKVIQYSYALSTEVQAGKRIRVTLSAVRDIDDFTINRPFSGAIDTAVVLVNGDSLMSVSHLTDYLNRQRAYNYFNDNIIPRAGEYLLIQAVIGPDTVTGCTVVPGKFSILSYTDGRVEWTHSAQARGYIFEAFIKETFDSGSRSTTEWRSFVKQVVFDTSFHLTPYIEYVEVMSHFDPEYSINMDSIHVEISGFEENYYAGILNEDLIAGVRNGYGVVAAFTLVDSIFAN